MNAAKNRNKIPVRLLAAASQAEIAVVAVRSATTLPAGPPGKERETDLRYGPYLEAVNHMLAKDDYQRLFKALYSRLNRVVTAEEIDCLEIKTEKHGAWYNVARVDINIAGQKIPFAVNVAAGPEALEQLEKEFRLLKMLNSRYSYRILPDVYFKGAGLYRERGKPAKWLHMFVAEWLAGYHEFHFHGDQSDGSRRMLLWDLDRGSRYLSKEQCKALYRQSAKILTLYYNWNNLRQIYPWHHAAGDFVLREKEAGIDLRLITVRDYVAMVDFTTGKKAGKLLALILFFLHLTIRMRMDRLDGVGDVVWAEDYCLDGVVPGFFEGLREGEGWGRRGMPSPSEIYAVLRSFSREEWVEFLVELLGTYDFSQEELSFIRDHGDGHLGRLQKLLATYG
ncbi:MAG: hypothetical protein P8075_04215 [Deltaproteobacteria bacterium]